MAGSLDILIDSNYRSVAYLIKTDAGGNELWSKTFGGSESDSAAKSVQQTSEGGYIAAGSIASSGEGGSDAFLIYYKPDPGAQPVATAEGGGVVVGDSLITYGSRRTN
jgi:hypothetical protein